MDSGLFGVLVLVLLVGNSLAILISRDWRWVLAALGVQYFLAFLLIMPSWPLELAAVKLVGGWMAAAILGLTRLNIAEHPQEAPRFPTSPAFLGFAAGLVILIVIGAAPSLAEWTHALSIYQAWGGLLLIGIALLQTGLGDNPFRNIVGLLTLLAGFEIIYAAVETSILVAGLLAIVNLGVALVGSYLMLAPGMEPRS